MTLKKNRRYIMLISTASPQWDTEAEHIKEALAREKISIITTIPISRMVGVDFIGISEDKNKSVAVPISQEKIDKILNKEITDEDYQYTEKGYEPKNK